MKMYYCDITCNFACSIRLAMQVIELIYFIFSDWQICSLSRLTWQAIVSQVIAHAITHISWWFPVLIKFKQPNDLLLVLMNSFILSGPVMTKFTIALREIGTYKEVLRSQVVNLMASVISLIYNNQKGVGLDFHR